MRALKQLAGKLLWSVSYGDPTIRERLWRYGIRTRQQWFAGKTARAFLPGGNSIRLTNVEENYMTFLLHWHGWVAYEPVTLLLIRELLRNRDSFVHVGANIGYFPICAAIENPTIEVIAFEPHPKISRIFRDNLRVNEVSNVVCESKAVSDSLGILKFYLGESDMSGSLESGFRHDHTGEVEVPVVTLDHYLGERPRRRRLLKVIVEGHETCVLRGARETLEAPETDLILAVVRELDEESHDCLRSLGYSFYGITDRGLVPEERIELVRVGDFSYLDHLVTRRSRSEVEAISERLVQQSRALDFQRSSHYRPDWRGFGD